MQTRKNRKQQRRHNKKTKYNMRGCSMKKRKHVRGGSSLSNVYLAYPSNNVQSVPNPHLAYTGKGGSDNGTCSGNLKPTDAELPQNINAANPAYPNTGPVNTGINFLNSQVLRGGCGCSGGVVQNGGNGLPYGQGLPEMNGIPYPNGLVGKPWGAEISQWPGVDGVSGGRDHLGYNNYIPDVSREMRMPIASNPFYGGGKHRKPKKGYKTKKQKSKSKSQKAGGLSNFMYQDLVNLGRQFTNGVENSYNALNGYSALPSPLPWKDQLSNV
jgi:hypothetical protein